MIKSALRQMSAAPALVVGKPQWWNTRMVPAPTSEELEMFNPKEEEVTTKYKPHPWFKNFGQDRLLICDPPPKGEFWRFKAFYWHMRTKNQELGFKGATWYYIMKMRQQKEAWFVKGYDEDILVGTDDQGNKYWQSSYTTAVQSRWIEFGSGLSTWQTDATQLDPQWYQWLHNAPDPEPHELRPRQPQSNSKDLSNDFWYKTKHSANTFAFERKTWPRGHPHPKNTKYDDFMLRKRRLSKRRGFMEFDPFVLPAERLRKRVKWGGNPVNDRKHSAKATKLPLGA